MNSKLKVIICVISIVLLIICNIFTLHYLKIDNNSLSNNFNEFDFESKEMMEKPDRQFNQEEQISNENNKPENMEVLNNINIYNESDNTLGQIPEQMGEMRNDTKKLSYKINFNVDYKSRLITLYIILLVNQDLIISLLITYLIGLKLKDKNINKKDMLLISIFIFIILCSIIGIVDFTYVCLI